MKLFKWEISVKKLLSAAGLLIAAGALLILGTLASVGFDLKELNTVTYTRREYAVEGAFHSIAVQAENRDVRLLPAEDGRCRVLCDENEHGAFAVEEQDGVLTVSLRESWKWWEHIGFFWEFSVPQVTVLLPEESYRELTVKTSSGDIALPKDFRFEQLSLKSASGDIRCQAAVEKTAEIETVSGELFCEDPEGERLRLESTSGGICLTGCRTGAAVLTNTSGGIWIGGAVFSGELQASSISGDIALSECRAGTLDLSTVSGSQLLRDTEISGNACLTSTSGEIVFEGFDAGEIEASAVSGSIRGTLRTGKIFQWETISGSASLPPSDRDGGTCRLETTSGDIELKTAS